MKQEHNYTDGLSDEWAFPLDGGNGSFLTPGPAAGFIFLACLFLYWCVFKKKKEKEDDEAPIIGNKCGSLHRTACTVLSCASFHSLQNSVNY